MFQAEWVGGAERGTCFKLADQRTLSLANQEFRRISDLASRLTWLPAGQIFYFCAGGMMRRAAVLPLLLFALACSDTPVEIDSSDLVLSRAGATSQILYTVGSPSPGGLWTTDLYWMDLNGNKPKRLTTNPGIDQMADWSPSGDMIVFTRTTSATANLRTAELYLMTVASDGTPGTPKKLTVTETPGADVYPAWSPDGTMIAFRCGNRSDICYTTVVLLPDGTPVSPPGIPLTSDPGSGHFYLDTTPTWSADSKEIMFARICIDFPHSTTKCLANQANQQRDLWKVDLSGKETRVTATPNINEDNPSWNPKNKREIVYNRISWYMQGGVEYESNDIYLDTIPATLPITNSGTQLTKSGMDDYPWWTPAGDKVLYMREKDGKFDVFRMPSDGSRHKNLTDTPGLQELFPRMRPDKVSVKK